MTEKLPSGVETTLQDLRAIVVDLGRTDSPGEMRRLFDNFLSKSQALTDHMRKEYKHLTGGKELEPKCFPGWDPVTELVKKLRTHVQHEAPILLVARWRYYYPITPAADAPRLVIQGDSGPLDSQETTIPPDSLGLHSKNPRTGVEQEIRPCKVELRLTPFADDPDVNAKLDKISDKDIRAIAESDLEVLEDYVVWYRLQLSEQRSP